MVIKHLAVSVTAATVGFDQSTTLSPEGGMSSRMSLRSSKLSDSPENHSSDQDDNLSVLSEDELEERDAEETLPCAECGKDLTTEESSTGCDYKFCDRWYHPSCLAPV